MSFETLILILVPAFALHNIEEWLGYDQWRETPYPGLNVKLKDRFVFGTALLGLTAMALGVAVAGLVIDSSWIRSLSRILVIMLLFNALSHCVASIKQKRWLPGTYSALFLILPLSLFALRQSAQGNGMTGFEAVSSFLLSLLLLPAATFGSLWGAYAIKRALYKRGGS